MSSNRRQATRSPKRLKVEYGTDAIDKRSTTVDISVGGLFLVVPRLLPINTRLHLHIFAPEGDFYAEGLVVRLKHTPPNLQQVSPQGMGIRFLEPAELISNMVPRAQRQVETLEVVCETVAELQALLRDQLSHGVIVVPAASPPPALNSIVEFDLSLPFRHAQPTLSASGRVVQLFETTQGDQTRSCAVIEVQDAAALCARLQHDPE